LPILVFFHGGGFVAGNLARTIISAFSDNRCECIVVSVGLSTCTGNKYPAAPEDAYSATKWVADTGDIGGIHDELLWEETAQVVTWAAVVALMARERVRPVLCFKY